MPEPVYFHCAAVTPVSFCFLNLPYIVAGDKEIFSAKLAKEKDSAVSSLELRMGFYNSLQDKASSPSEKRGEKPYTQFKSSRNVKGRLCVAFRPW